MTDKRRLPEPAPEDMDRTERRLELTMVAIIVALVLIVGVVLAIRHFH